MKKYLSMLFILLLVSCNSDDDETVSNSITINVDKIEAFSASVSWTTNMGSDVLYKVVLNNEVKAEALKEPSFTFNDLKGETRYEGIVYATNQNGDSTTFDTFTFTTLKNTLGAPINITSELNFPRVSVSWENSVDPNSEEINYKLYLTPWSVFEDVTGGYWDFFEDYKVPDGETTNTTFTFDDLSPFSRYRISIVATDSSGNMSKPTELQFVSVPSGTYDGDIYLDNQVYVDVFENHNLKILNGSLIIAGISSNSIYSYDRERISDLSSLRGFEEINGDVIIGRPQIDINSYNLAFNDLTFLEDLTKIEGDFVIANNAARVIPDFNELSVGGSIKIINTNIDQIIGFNGLTKINGDLQIELRNLKEINGFNNINEIQGNLIIANNKNLNLIGGFSKLNIINGDFLFKFNAVIKEIMGLDNINKINGNLIIEYNEELKRFIDFKNLNEVGGNLIIANNFNLYDFCGLNNLFVANGLSSQNYLIRNNAYNPTHRDFINGNCNN